MVAAEPMPGAVPPDVQETAGEDTAPHTGCPVAWCPICATVGAVQPLRPDVVEHLLKAGTELFLAFRAVVDVRADEVSGAAEEAPARTTLEKIDLG